LVSAAVLAGLIATATFLGLQQAQADEVQIPQQRPDPALRARLPKEIRDAGEIVSVNFGAFPPYAFVPDPHTQTGVSADLMNALGQLLGIRIRYESTSGLSAALAGIKAGRYQLSVGPVGDFPQREAANDFIDFVEEHVIFAVQAGNPTGIKSLEDACGNRVSVMAGGSAEEVIHKQAEDCAAAGKSKLEVQSYPDQPSAILAVRARRADAFFSSQAPLSYFVQQTHGQLQLAAVGKSNGFHNLYQGTVVSKDSTLGEVVLEGYRRLFENGTYAAIMKKYGLEANMLEAPGINLAGKIL
jgi:polar amino acid transport system substrate-binding protein